MRRRHDAWTFPVSDAAGVLTGIRLRLADGRKLSVRGGPEGLFVPADLGQPERLLIAEGPTDTASLLDLGLAAVGRPGIYRPMAGRAGGGRQLASAGLIIRKHPVQ